LPIARGAGDSKVHEIDFAPQDRKDGLGSDWHPSLKTHEIMAKKLVETIRRDFGLESLNRIKLDWPNDATMSPY